MRYQFKHFSPLQCGKVMAAISFFTSLVFAEPFFVFTLWFPGKGAHRAGALFGIAIMIMIPILYAFIGFIWGVVSCCIYNILAKHVGGIEFELAEVSRSDPASTQKLVN